MSLGDLKGSERRAWIASRLHPIERYDPSLANPRKSDYDLNPGLKVDNPHALRPAAVLVGLVEHDDGMTVLLTRRADTLRSHTGQIAFPGGRCDPGELPWQTALREAQEEVGLDPARVALAGLLHGYQTVTGFHVTPVVGFIDPKATFTLKEIMHDMCRQGTAIFFSTHVLDVAEKLCNKIAIIKHGRIIASGLMEELTEGHSLEEAFLEADGDE